RFKSGGLTSVSCFTSLSSWHCFSVPLRLCVSVSIVGLGAPGTVGVVDLAEAGDFGGDGGGNPEDVDGDGVAEFVGGILIEVVRTEDRRRVPEELVAERLQVFDDRGGCFGAAGGDVEEGLRLVDRVLL